MFKTPGALTETQRGDLEDVQHDLQSGPGGAVSEWVGLEWSSPEAGPSPFQLELILSGVALVFSLFVVGVSLALAAAESKDERDILTIAGAPPGTLARSAGARAWLLAVLGAAMAVPVGFLPVIVFARAQSQGRQPGYLDEGFPLVFPTRTVLLLVVVVPLVVCAVAWFSSATAQRFRPVRVSTAVFE
jgi:ABC-type lipoprotein release transport system permease subunit